MMVESYNKDLVMRMVTWQPLQVMMVKFYKGGSETAEASTDYDASTNSHQLGTHHPSHQWPDNGEQGYGSWKGGG